VNIQFLTKICGTPETLRRHTSCGTLDWHLLTPQYDRWAYKPNYVSVHPRKPANLSGFWSTPFSALSFLSTISANISAYFSNTMYSVTNTTFFLKKLSSGEVIRKLILENSCH
jgi:hypothetical protein